MFHRAGVTHRIFVERDTVTLILQCDGSYFQQRQYWPRERYFPVSLSSTLESNHVLIQNRACLRCSGLLHLPKLNRSDREYCSKEHQKELPNPPLELHDLFLRSTEKHEF